MGWALNPNEDVKNRLYKKTNHVCRVCFARIFAYDEQGDHYVECSNCGITKKSNKPESLCACGYKLRTKGKSPEKWPNAGFRCQTNKNIIPEMPSQIIVVYTGDKE